jgi:ferrous iron transport protein B
MMSKNILLVGRPNVGKSSLFNTLSNTYATVSNYPGTTVGITRGEYLVEGTTPIEILDLPGMYHFVPITEEEKVASKAILGLQSQGLAEHCARDESNNQLLSNNSQSLILHVVEGSKLPVHLPFTILLKNIGRPVILVINMMDEANAKGIQIDHALLSERLGIPVVPISAINKEGIPELKATIDLLLEKNPESSAINWPMGLSDKLTSVQKDALQKWSNASQIPKEVFQMIALEKGFVEDFYAEADSKVLESWVAEFQTANIENLQLYFYNFFKSISDTVLDGAFLRNNRSRSFSEKLSDIIIKPLFGIPLLLLILYFGIYEFVGVFGAGTVVGLIEEGIFGKYVTPVVINFFGLFLDSGSIFSKLFVGDYGVFTLGITYALALVLPVVFFFFLVFSMIEDSGYFPRLALLIDKVFKFMGLNGRAVIPMVLGLGCDTMATITTRTLETKKEKILATFLLALAVPCSAQLGLITGLVGKFGFGFWAAYVLIILFVLVLFGWIGKKLLKGDAVSFFMEMPPLRIPRIQNVLIKSFSRMKWYFFEVVPLFLIASVLLWLLDISGGITVLQSALEPVMGFIGLPKDAAESFLIGFFRRDFGAAGLFKLAQENPDLLSGKEILTGAVTLTLFVPCIAQFMIMWKERGPKVATITFVVITMIAFGVGGLLNQLIPVFTGVFHV